MTVFNQENVEHYYEIGGELGRYVMGFISCFGREVTFYLMQLSVSNEIFTYTCLNEPCCSDLTSCTYKNKDSKIGGFGCETVREAFSRRTLQ